MFGEQKYPVSAFFIFANVTIHNGYQVLLTLSEDRAARNIWTPPGGKVEVREGQTPREAAVAEVYQEVGLKIRAKDLLLMGDPQFIYPTSEYNPYDGIGLIILSYLHTGLRLNTSEIKLNKIPEKGCMIKEYKLVRLPGSMEEIEKWPFKVYPNYAEKLLEISNFLD